MCLVDNQRKPLPRTMPQQSRFDGIFKGAFGNQDTHATAPRPGSGVEADLFAA